MSLMSQLLEDSKRVISFVDMQKLCDATENFDYVDESIHGKTTRTFNYRLDIMDSFCNTGARNFRGTVFDLETKQLLALPFFKFFNLNQNVMTDKNTVEDWKMLSVFEKVDGSLIYFYYVGDNLVARTKRTCMSDQAIRARNLVLSNPYLKGFIDYWIRKGYTPMFELLSPFNRIVVSYDFEALCFLAIRNNTTGEIHFADMDILPYTKNDLVSIFPIYDIFNNINQIVETCLNERFNRDSILEGFTVFFDNGEIIKIKRLQWLELAKLREEVLSDVGIVKMLLEERLDDALTEFHDNSVIMNFVNMIVRSVNDTWNRNLDEGKKFYEENKDLPKKEFAIKAQGCLKESFPVAMKYYGNPSNPNLEQYRVSYLANRKWRKSKIYKETEIAHG